MNILNMKYSKFKGTLYIPEGEKAENKDIVLTIDKKEASVFGEIKENDVAPLIINGRTMVPVRFISESFGANVAWLDATKTVVISD